MAGDLAARPAPRPAALLPGLSTVPLRHRLYGFGSIYGKTLRDSRLSFIIAAGMLGGLALAMGGLISQVFPTPEARTEVNKLVGAMPAAMVNLFGNATLMGEKLGTLGGYMTWKYGALFALGTALWSIMALTGTLAGEASKGSLDLVAAAPFGKRRIALEKLFAHLTLVLATLVILAVATTVSSNAYGDPALGDPIPVGNALAFAAWVGALALCFGGLAFALSPALGRGGAAGLSSLVMMVLWAANGLDIGGPLLALSPFRWMNGHIPLVGLFDWPGVIATAALGGAFHVAGVVLFMRRDLGVTSGLSLPGLPKAALGVAGPISRAFGDQLPRALAWGLGTAIWGALLASLAGSFSQQLGGDQSLTGVFGAIFPGYDFATAGAWLQLYGELFFIFAGFAAATFVAGWASDETAGRLDMVLVTPLARVRWVVACGIAALGAVTLATALLAVGIGLGAASGGAPAGDAILGTASLGLFAAAAVGIGFAVGGVWRASPAAEVAAIFVVVTFLDQMLAVPLGLPDWVRQLALTTHFGQPMIGQWDAGGVAVAVVIALGGIAIGAWGFARRDIER